MARLRCTLKPGSNRSPDLDILILSTYDADGSGIFARQLLRSVHSLGYSAQIVTVSKTSPDPDVKGIYVRRSLGGITYSVKARLSRRLYRTKRDYAFLETCSISANAAMSADIWPDRCRLVICTFLSGMFSPEGFSKILARLGDPPVIFYGVDMNLFTGGCHYPRACRQYTSDCSNCPAVQPAARFLVKRNFQKKLGLVSSLANHTVVASSDEHRRQIAASRIFGESDIREILMSVSDEVYGANESSRQLLKADYGFGSRTLMVRSSSEPRKGGRLFVECIKLLHSESAELIRSLDIVAVGDQFIAGQLRSAGINVYSPGHVSDESELSRLYSVSDFFINPSLADGGPMMLAQSLMSCTPVITTDVGLARDLVVPGMTGTILEEAMPSRLASVIRGYHSKSDQELGRMRLEARKAAMTLLSKEVYIGKLSNLIKAKVGY